VRLGSQCLVDTFSVEFVKHSSYFFFRAACDDLKDCCVLLWPEGYRAQKIDCIMSLEIAFKVLEHMVVYLSVHQVLKLFAMELPDFAHSVVPCYSICKINFRILYDEILFSEVHFRNPLLLSASRLTRSQL
jgi:hypothetical protein